MNNYYQILGVQPTATKEEIKAAYLKLSKKIHPDMNNGDEYFTELFKNINEAYQVLTDDAKRKAFNYELNTVAADYNFIKHKERQLNEKEALLHHRQMRRKLFVRGSVSLFSGLAVIALFSLSFDQRSDPQTTPHAKRTIEVVQGNANTAGANAAENKVGANTMKQLYDAQKISETTIDNVVIKAKKAAAAQNIPQQKKAQTEAIKKQMTADEMSGILLLIEREKDATNSTSKCVKLFRSANSNIENPYDIARVLQAKGYVIAGRETSSKNVTGVSIDCTGKFICLTIGVMD